MLPQCRSTESPPEPGPPKTTELNFLDSDRELICEMRNSESIKTKFARASVLLYICVFHFATHQAHLRKKNKKLGLGLGPHSSEWNSKS